MAAHPPEPARDPTSTLNKKPGRRTEKLIAVRLLQQLKQQRRGASVSTTTSKQETFAIVAAPLEQCIVFSGRLWRLSAARSLGSKILAASGSEITDRAVASCCRAMQSDAKAGRGAVGGGQQEIPGAAAGDGEAPSAPAVDQFLEQTTPATTKKVEASSSSCCCFSRRRVHELLGLPLTCVCTVLRGRRGALYVIYTSVISYLGPSCRILLYSPAYRSWRDGGIPRGSLAAGQRRLEP